MAKRLKIVILYSYSENWIGGTYYIQNLIFALNKVEDSIKPLLLIASNTIDEYQSLIKLTKYPYTQPISLKVKQGLIVSSINKLSHLIFKKRLIKNDFTNFDVFFQIEQTYKHLNQRKVLYWIPDFQEYHLPEFFAEDDIIYRKNYQSYISTHSNYILFSSKSAANDFHQFHPQSTIKEFVLPFAVSHSALHNDGALQDLLTKFNLPEKYFICSNQFWIHKNHKVILKAIQKLKEKGTSITVAFSGKEYDYRFPEYFASIKQMCIELNILDNVRFLGFIDRGDQLNLIKNAQAVIQPSLFEGWSTVIEDGKALNANIIASNIDVHQEQLENYSQKLFFDPHNSDELRTCLTSDFKREFYNYEADILKYGSSFIDIARLITNRS
jgi:glycosyltransferase involved in cell wall biosynthesis